jgi:hypothetical protein
MNRTALLPVAFLTLCMLPLATVAVWTLLLLLIPAAVAAWLVRVGVDVGDDGITVRALLGQRQVPWKRLSGIRVAPRGELWLVTTEGTEVRLPVMRARDLPRLAALSGGRIEVPEPPHPGIQ